MIFKRIIQLKNKAIGLALVFALAVSTLFGFDTTACKACHGQHFEKHALGASKIVKDLNSTQIRTALIGYKNKTYGGRLKLIMQNQVKKYSLKDLNITKEDLNITTVDTVDSDETNISNISNISNKGKK